MVLAESLCASPFGTLYESQVGESFGCPPSTVSVISVWGGLEAGVGVTDDHQVLSGLDWTPKAPLPEPRRGGLQAANLGGDAWSFGGFGEGERVYNFVQSYSLIANAWTARQPDVSPRMQGAAASIHNQVAVTSGGFSSFGFPISVVGVHRLGEERPTFGPNLPEGHGRWEHSSFTLGDSVYVYGGVEEGVRASRDALWRWTPPPSGVPDQGEWIARKRGDRRQRHASSGASDVLGLPVGPLGKRAYISGGFFEDLDTLETVFKTDIRIFIDDPEGGRWLNEKDVFFNKTDHVSAFNRTTLYMITGSNQVGTNRSSRTIRYDIVSKMLTFMGDNLDPARKKPGGSGVQA